MVDLSATIAGIRFPFCAMNSAGIFALPEQLRRLAASESGAIVLKTATVHPFVHPQFRSLHNPGYDKLLPIVRELVVDGAKPVVASIAGSTVDEFVQLAHAFAEAGASLIEANLADSWIAATLAPFDEVEQLQSVCRRLVQATSVPVAIKLPDRAPMPYRQIAAELLEAGIRVVCARNDFGGLEKLLLDAHDRLEVIAVGGVRSGYDVARALSKGACAVQVGSALAQEGAGIFARLRREMLIARGERPEA